MNWFFKGLELSQEAYQGICRKFSARRETVSQYFIQTNLEEMLYAWAYAFFRRGEGYNVFWPALLEDVFESPENDIIKRNVISVISFQFGVGEGGLRGWFFENCWFIDGLCREGEARPRGRTSPMVRDLLDFSEELNSTIRNHGNVLDDVLVGILERQHKFANTLNDPELRRGVIESLTTGTGVAHRNIQEALQRFREDATAHGELSAAIYQWELTGNSLSSYRLQFRVCFKSRVENEVEGKIIRIVPNTGRPIESRVACGVARFDGGVILDAFANASNESELNAFRCAIDANIHMPSIKGAREELRALLGAAKNGRPICFKESASDVHSIIDLDAYQKIGSDEQSIPEVVSRSILTVGVVDQLQGANELIALYGCNLLGHGGMAVARSSDLDFSDAKPKLFDRFNVKLWYRRWNDAAQFRGEREDVFAYLVEAAGSRGRKLHVFSDGAGMTRLASDGSEESFIPPADRNVLLDKQNVVYFPNELIHAIESGSEIGTAGWHYAPLSQTDDAIRINGSRGGVLTVNGSRINVSVVVRYDKPKIWLEHCGRRFQSPREFNSIDELEGWFLCCIPANDAECAAKQSLRFEYVNNGCQQIPIGNAVWMCDGGVIKINLRQWWRDNRNFTDLTVGGWDCVKFCGEDECVLWASVYVEPKEIVITQDEQGGLIFAPSRDDRNVVLILSERALDVDGSLKAQESSGQKNYVLLEPGVNLEKGSLVRYTKDACREAGLPDSYAVYAIKLGAEEALAVVEDFSAFKEVAEKTWHVIQRTNCATSELFSNYDLVSSRLEQLLSKDDYRAQPRAFEWARLFCESIEQNPTRLTECWKRHLQDGDSIEDTLRSLLDGAIPINIFASPEPAQFNRAGWNCRTWLDLMVRNSCGLDRRGRDAVWFDGSHIVIRRGCGNAREIMSKLSAWLSPSLSLVVLNSPSLGNIRAGFDRHVVEQLRNCGVHELEVLIGSNIRLGRNIWPYNRENVDESERMELFASSDQLEKIAPGCSWEHVEYLGSEDDAKRLAGDLLSWSNQLYESDWPSRDSDYAYVLNSVLDQIAREVDGGCLPWALCLLALAAIGSRTCAIMGAGDKSRILFSYEESSRIRNLANMFRIRGGYINLINVIGRANYSNEQMIEELSGRGLQSMQIEEVLKIVAVARERNVPYPSEESMFCIREVIRKAFLAKYNNETADYWAVLMFYIVATDVMIYCR